MIQRLQHLLSFPDGQAEHNEERLRQAFRHLPVLESARLRLRPPELSDADDMYAYARDEENCRYVLWDAHRTPQDSRSALRSMISQNRRGLPASFAVELKSEARMIGTIGFQTIEPDSLRAEVGYTIARRLWNQGLGSEALSRLLTYAFDVLDLRLVEAKHDVLNPASGRVMAHAGMRAMEIERRSLLLKGRMADMQRYAISQEEWRGLER